MRPIPNCVFLLCAAFATVLPATAAPQPPPSQRASSDYAAWAGSRANADSLMTGLRSGTTITLVTTSRDGSASMAGFTPAAPMGESAIRSTLVSAQRALSRAGIAQPTAEEIQAALIGGDVTDRNGRTTTFAGLVSPRGPA